jgi:hypothetical protein
MTPNPPQLLGPADLALLNRTLQGCADIGCVVTKLKALGFPTEDFEAELTRQQKTASGLKATFFPDHP